MEIDRSHGGLLMQGSVSAGGGEGVHRHHQSLPVHELCHSFTFICIANSEVCGVLLSSTMLFLLLSRLRQSAVRGTFPYEVSCMMGIEWIFQVVVHNLKEFR